MGDFVSRYINRIDAKGRVSIPASFRSILAAEGVEKLYCCPTLDRQAIDAGGGAFRAAIAERLNGFVTFSEEHEFLSTALLGDSEELRLDGDGRITLSESLVAHAGLSDQAAFVGQGYKFQIWAPERFAHYLEQAREKVRELRKSLSTPINPGGTLR